ncbi:helix-turn-helix domain-containing protein [Nocardia vinacea]|uniref:Helix-turn-helix domain-containing protein n=1 Tax=Nocardia vinacea TaxID=96468 RepID=A0ABZ1YQG6_9NOCA|nr:helix-turn-helix domain-containing protein [Nocardia vinacea]
MQLRYSYRLYPTSGQQTKLAKAFGCARVASSRLGRPRG